MVDETVVITGTMVLMSYLMLPWADPNEAWGGLASIKRVWLVSALITAAAYIAVIEGANKPTVGTLVVFNLTALLWAPTVVFAGNVRPFLGVLLSVLPVTLTALASVAIAIAVMQDDRGALIDGAAVWIVLHHTVIDLLLWTWE